MICIIISEHFRNYEHFAPIDAEMLKRYGILKQLGFYPIERKSVRNIAKFLQTSLHILNHKCHAVWITAQGEFRDARQRPLQLQPGVGHIAARMEHGWIVPIALEYGFWDESQPEALGHGMKAEPGISVIICSMAHRTVRQFAHLIRAATRS